MDASTTPSNAPAPLPPAGAIAGPIILEIIGAIVVVLMTLFAVASFLNTPTRNFPDEIAADPRTPTDAPRKVGLDEFLKDHSGPAAIPLGPWDPKVQADLNRANQLIGQAFDDREKAMDAYSSACGTFFDRAWKDPDFNEAATRVQVAGKALRSAENRHSSGSAIQNAERDLSVATDAYLQVRSRVYFTDPLIRRAAQRIKQASRDLADHARSLNIELTDVEWNGPNPGDLQGDDILAH